jgi:hypothetical protein
MVCRWNLNGLYTCFYKLRVFINSALDGVILSLLLLYPLSFCRSWGKETAVDWTSYVRLQLRTKTNGPSRLQAWKLETWGTLLPRDAAETETDAFVCAWPWESSAVRKSLRLARWFLKPRRNRAFPDRCLTEHISLLPVQLQPMRCLKFGVLPVKSKK